MRSTSKPALFVFTLIAIVACQTNPYRQGHTLYLIHCANCHMEDGSGLEELIPSLKTSSIFDSPSDDLVCLIRRGLKKNPETGQEMPGNSLLTEVEITNLANYLRSLYSVNTSAVKVSEVKTWLESCP